MVALRHIAIIPDGNRRYAKKMKISLAKAYRIGVERTREIVKHAFQVHKLEELTFYTLSSRNVRARKKGELKILVGLLSRFIQKAIKERFWEEIDAKILFLGDFSIFPCKLRRRMRKINEMSDGSHRLNLLVNYDGREEILRALSNMKRVSMEEIWKHLYVRNEPDLIIRTSGERRLSGFLTFQCAYSELYFCEKLWPEFTKEDFDRAVEDYFKRERRFGR